MTISTLATELACTLKARLAGLADAAVAHALQEWPRHAPTREVVPDASLPVLRWLPQIANDADAWDRHMVSAVCRAASALSWRRSYDVERTGASFMDNYGYCELIGTSGPLASECLACGFLLLGAATHYPAHRHQAQEVYLPVSGTASWRQGDGVWRDHRPGTAIHHASEEPHAMRTGSAPLLAVYLWTGALHSPSRLDPP